MNLNTWNFIATSYDGNGVLKLHVNGSTESVGRTLNTVSNKINLFLTTTGSLGEMMIYDRDLSASDLEYIYNDFKPIQKVVFHNENMELLLITLTYGQKYVFSKKHNFFILLDGKVSLHPNYNMMIESPREIYYIENVEDIEDIENNKKDKMIVSQDYSIILNLSMTKNIN